MAVDLSRDAIAARRRAAAKLGGDGAGHTGSELIDVSARVFDRAKQLQKAANARPRGKRREKLDRKADEALLTAATQIRLAGMTPLDRGYLHVLTIKQIENARRQAIALYDRDPAALAVDTHRRIQIERRRRAEGRSEP